MRKLLLLPLLFASLSAPSLNAADDKLDPVSKQAAAWEADLGKVRDSSPEAAAIMLKLVDLYHANARVFGLIRVGETFVTKHPSHPQHKAVMLQLIDGLQAMSRNKDLSATCRQFLTRYPDAPEVARVEVTLAQTQEQLGDRPRAAEAYAAVFKRQPTTPLGRSAAVKAIDYYGSIAGADGYAKTAELAGALLDQLPPGEFASEAGQLAVNSWRRISQWAKANVAANKTIPKMPPSATADLAEMHFVMAQIYGNLSQSANAVASLRKARALGDRLDLHQRMIVEMHNAGAQPADMQPVVDEYVRKYPDRPDRFAMRNYLAEAYLRAGDKPRALAILAELLPVDAVTGASASLFVQNSGSEPAQLAETEKVLQAAIAKNPAQAQQLRFTLATDLYRDRLKDNEKARAIFKDIVAQPATPDSSYVSALQSLLSSPAGDDEFKSTIVGYLKVRKRCYERKDVRNALKQWIAAAEQKKEPKSRIDYAKSQLQTADRDPGLEEWLATESPSPKVAVAARAKLLSGRSITKLDDDQVRFLAAGIGLDYSPSSEPGQRHKASDIYAQVAKRFPSEAAPAYAWLNATLAGGPPGHAKVALVHILAQEPDAARPDLWYRMLLAASRGMGDEQVEPTLAWILKAQAKFGPDSGNAEQIGDILEKNGLKKEAIAYWRSALAGDPNSSSTAAAAMRLADRLPAAERKALLEERMARHANNHGLFAAALAADAIKAGDLDSFEKILAADRKIQDERPLRPWNFDSNLAMEWVDAWRANKTATLADKQRVLSAVRNLDLPRPSSVAQIALMELAPDKKLKPLERLLAYQAATRVPPAEGQAGLWDRMLPFAQAAMARKDYEVAATLLTGMLANIANVDATRQQAGRDMVAQSYARMGGVGLTIDENSPIAPLLQAAMYLRLGDERLALETYAANKSLFVKHRTELPVDLLLFVAESLVAAGGDENLERAEDFLRGWLVKYSESAEIEPSVKASVQLLLARNYFKAQRYDVARNEFTTVLNRYPKTLQALEAEFGIGECFMAQKVFDQAEAIFDKLANSPDRDVIIRAEFLRGVLASRRGDREQARDIFRAVLERVPDVELANQALYNLAEVYGAEERYIDQLELLRTVGRLGRASKHWHTPGTSLSIVVQDSDLGISRGHTRIPVLVTTEPGGDEELVYVHSGGAGKGLFRADLDTRLGQVVKNDKILEVTGRDLIKVDYPEEFKKEFRTAPISDAEIRIASNGKLEASGAKIIGEQAESFSQRLEREAQEDDAPDQRKSQSRPANQIKPGNPIYLRVEDADRDLSDEPDKVTVKLVATSGDQVQASLIETGPHTGVFEAAAQTGELPAGALASDTSIEHSPLMAIDQSDDTAWISQPDGATPKWLSVDMKELHPVSRVTITTPDAANQAPVRGELLGSDDGRFWFRLASQPRVPDAAPVALPPGPMSMRVYAGDFTNVNDWSQVVDLTKSAQPIEQQVVEQLSWSRPRGSDKAKQPAAVVWHGKLIQKQSGAARILVRGGRTALVVDGSLELAPGADNRAVDVWLERGAHDLTIFSATNGIQGAEATWARADSGGRDKVALAPFRRGDFDTDQPEAKIQQAAAPAGAAASPAGNGSPAETTVDGNRWSFQFPPRELRYVRLVIHEYRGDAVAINKFEIAGPTGEIYIPTKDDILALANNDVLEIAAGDTILASYTDEFTQSAAARSQLLTAKLSVTFYNATVSPIAYDFARKGKGSVKEERKRLKRLDPGHRFVLEITDFDEDKTVDRDEVSFEVAVNDGPPVKFTAQETQSNTGVFTREIDTVAPASSGPAPSGAFAAGAANAKTVKPEGGSAAPKLPVKPGDRIYCRYRDTQNTFPGHAVVRETVVYVNEPSDGNVRIVETRVGPPVKNAKGGSAPPRITYLPFSPDKPISTVAFDAPLTIEVVDPDMAKDSKSQVTVHLVTTGGAKVDVECVISDALGERDRADRQGGAALDEGRFVGQVLMQLGSKSSPELVPVTGNQPRRLLGAVVAPRESGAAASSESGGGEEGAVARVLNLAGRDIVTATYRDERRPDGKPVNLESRGRLIANGSLASTDHDYEKPITQLHVGERLYLKVTDADLDVSDQRDRASVEISSSRGEKETLLLEETLTHSGVFTGSATVKPVEKPTPGNLDAGDPVIESYFGDVLRLKYVDASANTESGTLDLELEVPVVAGADGVVAAFSKTFDDEQLAVETQFHIAESYFELFKSHKQLGRQEDQQADLEAGRRVLKEVMQDYPSPKHAPRVAYLLGQFSQELRQWDEAIGSYQLIVRQFPDSSLAADAQYKLAQCLEESGDFDGALEAYVTLAATYPKSPLIANVMVRISDHFYKKENYVVSAQVGEKFLQRFEGHEWAPRMAFRVGQCYYKGKLYDKAASAFDRFTKIFPDDPLSADALFWAGESFRSADDMPKAFRRYNRCRWDFPASEAAKYARGRLALPEMLSQFEAESKAE